MSKIAFEHRYVFDRAFYDEIKNQGQTSICNKLMYISDRSKLWPRQQNAMSKATFSQLVLDTCAEKDQSDRPAVELLLRRMFYPIDEPEPIEIIQDEVERTIKYAIELASDRPLRTIIFTSEAKIETYRTNSHFAGVKSISVKAGNDAWRFLENRFSEATDQFLK
ncbi:MAG: hypothetical protein WC792_04100 [Candidatus Micrarchaeia archaeon]|jgi:hypothetical protein